MAENTTAPQKPAKKTPKPKGPIRTGVVVPFFIFVAIVWVYFFFFFDMHVRHALEYVGTQANGAEVDIANVRTSFWNASLEINNIQVTSATEPTKNKIQIGRVHWQMLWDALLRGKVAINDASILEIALGAPRSRPGRVLPPPPPPTDKPSAFSKAKDEALKRVEDEFNKNVLGDAAALLRGADPASELKNIEASLKSSARIKELQTELAAKEKAWKERLDKLPQQKDLQALQDRIKAVKLDHFNGPQEVQQSIQQLDSIYKDANAQIQNVNDTQKALGSDVGTYQNSLKDLEGMVQQDIKDLENHVKLPKLDFASLSKSLFGGQILGRVKQAEFYMNKAREYMPPKKPAAEKGETKPPTPHEREKGRNYKFGHPNAYPLFWLKKAAISSKAIPGADYSGNLTGALLDVTDDQPLTGRPMMATFKGDFPQKQIAGIDGKLTIDHRTDKPVEGLNLKVASFPVENRILVNSPDVKVAIDGAVASTSLDATLSGDEIKIDTLTDFLKRTAPPTPAVPAPPPGSFLKSEAQQPILAEILKNAFNDIQKVNLKANVSGSWTSPQFDIDSNIGRDLSKAFEKQLQAKVAEARAKIQNIVNEQIGKQKEQLMAEFNKQKAMIDNLIKEKQGEIDKAKGQIDKAKNDAVKGQSKQLQEQGGKAVDELKKRFGF